MPMSEISTFGAGWRFETTPGLRRVEAASITVASSSSRARRDDIVAGIRVQSSTTIASTPARQVRRGNLQRALGGALDAGAPLPCPARGSFKGHRGGPCPVPRLSGADGFRPWSFQEALDDGQAQAEGPAVAAGVEESPWRKAVEHEGEQFPGRCRRPSHPAHAHLPRRGPIFGGRR